MNQALLKVKLFSAVYFVRNGFLPLFEQLTTKTYAKNIYIIINYCIDSKLY